MRNHSAFASLLVLCVATGAFAQSTSAPSCDDLHLIPAPRECRAVQSIPIAGRGFFVSAEKNADDEFTAKDLIEQSLGKRTVHDHAPKIRLERAESH